VCAINDWIGPSWCLSCISADKLCDSTWVDNGW
jgi:hypothetical protein